MGLGEESGFFQNGCVEFSALTRVGLQLMAATRQLGSGPCANRVPWFDAENDQSTWYGVLLGAIHGYESVKAQVSRIEAPQFVSMAPLRQALNDHLWSEQYAGVGSRCLFFDQERKEKQRRHKCGKVSFQYVL